MDITFRNEVTLYPLFVNKPNGGANWYNGVQYASIEGQDLLFSVGATVSYDYAINVNASRGEDSGTNTFINMDSIRQFLIGIMNTRIGDSVSAAVPQSQEGLLYVAPRTNYTEGNYYSLCCGDITAGDAYGGGDYSVMQTTSISFT